MVTPINRITMLLTLSIENMHGLLQDLYSEMMKMCRPISDVALPLAALGALFFIAYRVWQSLARGEPIDVFGLLRPFVLGICILFFDTMVLGTINGIFQPIVQGTGAMLRDEQFDVREYPLGRRLRQRRAVRQTDRTVWLKSGGLCSFGKYV